MSIHQGFTSYISQNAEESLRKQFLSLVERNGKIAQGKGPDDNSSSSWRQWRFGPVRHLTRQLHAIDTLKGRDQKAASLGLLCY